jgi:hypothetical protein
MTDGDIDDVEGDSAYRSMDGHQCWMDVSCPYHFQAQIGFTPFWGMRKEEDRLFRKKRLSKWAS